MKPVVPVTVIVVSFNTKELTHKALTALYNSTVQPANVVVVDNDSKDGSVDMIKTEFPEVSVIENHDNLGFAKANNQAIVTASTQPYVWLLNSDTETGAQSLEQLVTFMEAHPRVAAVGPVLVYPTRAWQSVGGYFPTVGNVFAYLVPYTYFLPVAWRKKLRSIALYPQEIPAEGLDLDYVTGAAVLLRRAALDQSGLLAEDYFMYFEETDLCWRLRKNAWELKVIPTEPVMHVYGGSFKTKVDSRRLGLFLNSLRLFVNKYYSGVTRHLILLEIALFGKLSILFKQIKNHV